MEGLAGHAAKSAGHYSSSGPVAAGLRTTKEHAPFTVTGSAEDAVETAGDAVETAGSATGGSV